MNTWLSPGTVVSAGDPHQSHPGTVPRVRLASTPSHERRFPVNTHHHPIFDVLTREGVLINCSVRYLRR
jgi:hypothetical protein